MAGDTNATTASRPGGVSELVVLALGGRFGFGRQTLHFVTQRRGHTRHRPRELLRVGQAAMIWSTLVAEHGIDVRQSLEVGERPRVPDLLGRL